MSTKHLIFLFFIFLQFTFPGNHFPYKILDVQRKPKGKGNSRLLHLPTTQITFIHIIKIFDHLNFIRWKPISKATNQHTSPVIIIALLISITEDRLRFFEINIYCVNQNHHVIYCNVLVLPPSKFMQSLEIGTQFKDKNIAFQTKSTLILTREYIK